MSSGPANSPRSEAAPQTAPDDGTAQLLRWGASTIAVGLVAALLAKTVFGGIGRQGPHTNSGWLALIVTMMSLPFGCMAFLLGAAKWLRNRRHPPSR
jgi:hypothetical protein